MKRNILLFIFYFLPICFLKAQVSKSLYDSLTFCNLKCHKTISAHYNGDGKNPLPNTKNKSVLLIKKIFKKLPVSSISFFYRGDKYYLSILDSCNTYPYKEGEEVELDITFFENIKEPYSDDIPFAIVTDIRKKEKCNR